MAVIKAKQKLWPSCQKTVGGAQCGIWVRRYLNSTCDLCTCNPSTRCNDLLLLSDSPQQAQPSQSQSQQQLLSQQQQQQQLHVKQLKRREPDMHFFNHAVAPQYPRRPVQWLRPSDNAFPHQSVDSPVHAVAEDDPWALGEAPAARRQAPPQPRKRLSWAQNPPHQSGMDQSFAQSSSGWRRPGKQDREQAKLLEAERQQRQALAASASQEQYLRNKLQVEQQIAQHAAIVQRQQDQQRYDKAQRAAAQPSYAALAAPPKPKAPPPPPPVHELPTEVVIPPDVTVRQLAQLLGKQAIMCQFLTSPHHLQL